MKEYYNRKKSPLKAFIWVLILFMMGWTGAYFYYNVEDQVGTQYIDYLAQDDEDEIELDLFWDVWGVLDDEYVDVMMLDDEDMMYGAIEGMVNGIGDPYTVYMPPDDASDFQDSLNGELEGIGAELTVKDGELVIIAPIKDTPAEEAGLLPGDIIYYIDSERANEMSVYDAVMAIRGEAGSIVELTIAREGEEDFLVFNIERARFDINSVDLEITDGIAHLSIHQFTDDTTDEFNKAVTELLLEDVDGVVLDIRSNSGGYLESSVDILSEFLDKKQKAVTAKMREEEDNEIYYTHGDGRLTDYPLVVLVNGGSASASEILAGAIQDYELGIIIGDQTFGKGSVQRVEEFSDGSSLRVTIAKWYTPDGRSISESGITPDIEVSDDYETEEDEQLDEAILYLQGL